MRYGWKACAMYHALSMGTPKGCLDDSRHVGMVHPVRDDVATSTPAFASRNVLVTTVRRICETVEWSTDTSGRGIGGAASSAVYQSESASAAVSAKTVVLNCAVHSARSAATSAGTTSAKV